MKQTVLALCLGTSCDFRLMDYAVLPMMSKYNIVYITDKKHKIPEGCQGSYFHTPEFLTNDIDLAIANTSKNIFHWAIVKPKKVYDAFSFYQYVKDKIVREVEKHNPVAMIVLYPAFGIICRLPEEIIEKVPTYVYYYAPGYVNKKLPWLFDSRMKSSRLQLYKNDPEQNYESGMEYLKRVLMASGNDVNIFKKMTHVICWDKNILPDIPIEFADVKTMYLGSLLPPVIRLDKWSDMPDFGDKDIIFMSFGSYGTHKSLERVIEYLYKKLVVYCKKNNCVVLHHNGTVRNEYVYGYEGFIPYEYIVPRSKLVIFTGSVCLQTLCLYHMIPMLFVPLLAEQYFWAKNYKHFTGVGFVNPRRKINKVNVDKAMVVNKYLKSVSKSLRRYPKNNMINVA